ncbi:GNAT family N-acetyltransferase [Pelagicoccus mobilis]|uniref:GNAT family N-acetyltransferase n=1 Tax=Pelagicoccus mobilis TaxID=415221 RepID=A0A934VTT8_9BACT|nr:GNAT family N-acetyltransferase [Pelagicoccus mobilis]MBK1880415.1 GNAT family N-acetyltransferase [Pelagicoccus mobilis]
MELSYATASPDDFESLLELRLLAMRPSLKAIGRFDPQRSAERFKKSFAPQNTEKLIVDRTLVGFVAVTTKNDHLYLDHLYIHPDFQSSGIGSQALTRIIQSADEKQLPIKLNALRSSPSNSFYKRHGFRVTREEEWDIYYERPTTPAT